MANCYVVTALAAIVGSRILYVVTNPDEFKSVWDLFALRHGGLVAYGGFLGGLLGSWAYPRAKADPPARRGPTSQCRASHRACSSRASAATSSAATSASACPTARPTWLKTLGHVPALGRRARSPAARARPRYVRHLDVYRGTPSRRELVRMNASFAVHPTQLYESLVGLVLLVAAPLAAQATSSFRGQIFFLFVFAYGFLRFFLELWRDDVERGSYGPTLDAHVYIPLCLLLMGLGFVFGISLGIANKRARTVARVLAFVPPVLAYLALKPASFGQTVPYQLSTSQLDRAPQRYRRRRTSTRRFWEQARRSPRLAMSLGDEATIRELKGETAPAEDAEEDEEDDEADDAEEAAPAPRAKTGQGKKKGLAAKSKKEPAETKGAAASDAKGDPEPEPGAT